MPIQMGERHSGMPTHRQHRPLCKTLGNAPLNIFIGCHGLFFAKSNVAGSLLATHKGQALLPLLGPLCAQTQNHTLSQLTE